MIGNPKITGNPRTIRTVSKHVDVDVSGVLRRDMTLEQAGDTPIETIMRVASGRSA